MTATVVAGAVTFYLNRGVLGDVEEEARQEEIEEKRRGAWLLMCGECLMRER